MHTPNITLYEDWTQRRNFLKEHMETCASAQIHILEYLLRRYEGAPEAARPARYALPAEMVFKLRNIVVNHHLGQGKVAGAKSIPEANDRVARIAKRMAERDAQADLCVPGGGSLAGPIHGQVSLAESLSNAFEYQVKDMEAVMGGLMGAKIPVLEFYTKQLVAQLSHAQRMSLFRLAGHYLKPVAGRGPLGGIGRQQPSLADTVSFFVRIEDPEGLGFVHFAWMDLLTEHKEQRYLIACELIFRAQVYQEDALELLRGDLSSHATEIRSRALMLLSTWGSLQDIGLLSDLLNLPPQGDEYEGEREALASAMKNLAEDHKAGGG